MSAIGEIIGGIAGKVFNVFKLGIGVIAARLLSFFGLTMISMNAVLPNLKAMLLEYVNRLPPKALQMASALGVDVFFTIILSALTIRLAWKVFIVPTSVANQLGGGGQ